jgi:hypothetical protein
MAVKESAVCHSLTHSVPFLSPEERSKLGFTFMMFKLCNQHGSCWDRLCELRWLHPFLCADTNTPTWIATYIDTVILVSMTVAVACVNIMFIFWCNVYMFLFISACPLALSLTSLFMSTGFSWLPIFFLPLLYSALTHPVCVCTRVSSSNPCKDPLQAQRVPGGWGS